MIISSPRALKITFDGSCILSDLQKNNNQTQLQTIEQQFGLIEQYYKRMAKKTTNEVLMACVGTMLIMNAAVTSTMYADVITVFMLVAQSVAWVMTAIMVSLVFFSLYRWFMVRHSMANAQSAFNARDRAYIQNLYEQIQRTQKRTRGSK